MDKHLKDVHVYRFLEEVEVEVKELVSMAHKDASNSSFKVTIFRKDVEKVFDEGFWQVCIGCCFF